MFLSFVNEPYSDYTVPANEAAYRLALAGVREQLGLHYPLIIGGEAVDTGRQNREREPLPACGSGWIGRRRRCATGRAGR